MDDVDTDNKVNNIINLFNDKIDAANKTIGDFKNGASTTLTTINGTIIKINNKLQELLDEIGKLEQTEIDNQAEIDRLTEQVAVLTKEKGDLKIQMEKLQSELEQEKEKTTNLGGEIAKNKENIKAAEIAKNTAVETLEKQQAAHLDILKDKIDAKQLKDLVQSNKEITDKLDEQIKEKTDEISTLTGQNIELTEKLEGATKKVDELNESTRLLQGAIGQAKSQSTGALQRLEEVQESNIKLTEELTKANDGLAAIKFAINKENVDVDWEGLLKQINEILTGVQQTNQLVDKLTANPKKVNRVMSMANEINSGIKDPTKEAKQLQDNIKSDFVPGLPAAPNRNSNLYENKQALKKLMNEGIDDSIVTVQNIIERSDQSKNGNVDQNKGGKRRKSKGKTRKVRKHATKKKRKPLVGGKKRKQTRKRRSRKAKKANKKK